MRLASLREGGRDGRLCLVSADGTRAVRAIAATSLLEAMDRWDEVEPRLRAEARALEEGRAPGAFPFDPSGCAAPLPRTWQWLDGSAYLNHVELVRRARGATMPPSFLTDPLMYQGGSDGFLGPTDPIPLLDPAMGLDLEGEVAVVLGDVPMAAGLEEARAAIRLVLLVNDLSLRNVIPAELAKGFGFLNGKPASALSPLALTPDELGPAWDGNRLSGALLCSIDGRLLGRPDAGRDMQFGFPELVVHAARTRPLAAGTILGGGTVSNRQDLATAEVERGGVGFACIAEARMVETIRDGAPHSPFLAAGDRVRIEMLDPAGRSIFGAIDQEVVPFTRSRS